MFFNGQGGADLSLFSALDVFRDTSDQTIPTVTWTTVEFNSSRNDKLSEFDIVTNHKYTALRAGRILVCASVQWKDWTVDEYGMIAVRQNTVSLTAKKVFNPTIDSWTLDTVRTFLVEAGDDIDVQVYNHCGVGRDILLSGAKTFLNIFRFA